MCKVQNFMEQESCTSRTFNSHTHITIPTSLPGWEARYVIRIHNRGSEVGGGGASF